MNKLIDYCILPVLSVALVALAVSAYNGHQETKGKTPEASCEQIIKDSGFYEAGIISYALRYDSTEATKSIASMFALCDNAKMAARSGVPREMIEAIATKTAESDAVPEDLKNVVTSVSLISFDSVK